MKIIIIGIGYVGLVIGVCLVELGNDVFCLDVDQCKVDIFNNGGIFIYEFGLEEVVVCNCVVGCLYFFIDVVVSVVYGDIQFIVVGMLLDEDGLVDL